jgi:flagellar biosynthetic protein FliR
MSRYFLLGIGFAFPILAISLLSDIIFAMIMKTMPQFNLLVVGFPIKIGVSFVVLIVIISSMMNMFSKEIQDVFNTIAAILG